ncbi:MAG: hypothetical protein ACU836_13870, partial [Gammaproteobacteria bacterium]
MIIFTGSGRSGTGLYSKLFDTHHEYNVNKLIGTYFPRSALFLESDPFDDFELRKRIMLDHLAGIDFSKFRDSSNPYVSFLDALYVIDNEVKIVLGARDGRDFCVSGITRGYHDNQRYSGYSITPYKSDPLYSRWQTLSPLEKMAWSTATTTGFCSSFR